MWEIFRQILGFLMTLLTTPSKTTGRFTATSAMHLVIAAAKKSLLETFRLRKRSRYSARGTLPSRRVTTTVASMRWASVSVRRNAPTMTKPNRLEPRLSVCVLARVAMSSVRTRTPLRSFSLRF